MRLTLSFVAPSVQSVRVVFLWSGQSPDCICCIPPSLLTVRDFQQGSSEAKQSPDNNTHAKTGRNEANSGIRIDGLWWKSGNLKLNRTEIVLTLTSCPSTSLNYSSKNISIDFGSYLGQGFTSTLLVIVKVFIVRITST